MQHGTDYLFFEEVDMMTSKSLKQFKAVMIGTKNYVFTIPIRSFGAYVLFSVFTTHRYFAGSTVPEGCKKLISEAQSVEELEATLLGMLENDHKFAHKISETKEKKMNRFLWTKTYTFRLIRAGMGYTAVTFKGQDKADLIRQFYNF